jgi:DNA-binding MarR family transcriptional regulator
MAPSIERITRTDSGLASSLRVSIARLNRRLRNEHDEVPGISPGWAAVLGLLNREGERTIGQLAAAERVQPPSMTRSVSCMEKEGLVQRRPHATDGRQVVITLSDRGRELLLADRRRRDAWLARRLRELTSAERSLLRQAAPILEKLSNS